jgi:hypothetical protein
VKKETEMSYQQQSEGTEIFFSGEIKGGKIIGLTAKDNRGGEYKITIQLEQINAGDLAAICWECSKDKDKDKDDLSKVMICRQVPCFKGKE